MTRRRTYNGYSNVREVYARDGRRVLIMRSPFVHKSTRGSRIRRVLVNKLIPGFVHRSRKWRYVWKGPKGKKPRYRYRFKVSGRGMKRSRRC
jgi:hypothetical protein